MKSEWKSLFSQETVATSLDFEEPTLESSALGLDVDLLDEELGAVSEFTSGTLTEHDASAISKQVELEEIKLAIKGANPNKLPGPDGFNAHFFKVCWPIRGEDVVLAISDFFKHGMLLKQVKNSFITLIPKFVNPCKAADYRPISLTNELNKIIAHILAARVKPLVDRIINPCQTAFIPERSIVDNVGLLCACEWIICRIL